MVSSGSGEQTNSPSPAFSPALSPCIHVTGLERVSRARDSLVLQAQI